MLLRFNKEPLINSDADDKVLDLLRSGSPNDRNKAMKDLYSRCYKSIKNYILKNSGTEDDAADVFQDSIVIFYQKVMKDEFENRSGIGTYLYAVAKNLWLKKLREGRLDLSKLKVEERYVFDEELIIQTYRLTMRDVLEQIGETCKNLLIDFYYHKKSMDSLMQTYGLGSNEAARNKKYRCLQKLMTFVRENRLKRTDFLDE